jgi:hypothetical protein
MSGSISQAGNSSNSSKIYSRVDLNTRVWGGTHRGRVDFKLTFRVIMLGSKYANTCICYCWHFMHKFGILDDAPIFLIEFSLACHEIKLYNQAPNV